jgi:hypothetical protein
LWDAKLAPSALLEIVAVVSAVAGGQPMLVRIWALAAVWPRRSKGSSPAPFPGCCAADDCSEQREQCALALTSQTSQWAILAIFSARLREYLQTWKSFQSSSPNTPRLISFSISPTQGETPKQELGAGRDSRPCPPSPVQFSRTALHSLDPVRASPDAVLLARRLDAQLISARGHPHHQPSCQSLALPVVFISFILGALFSPCSLPVQSG